MRKRALGLLLGAMFFALCSSGQAQQSTRILRLGFLTGGSAAQTSARTDAFRHGLRELGYVEGKNIVIEYRYAEGRSERLPELATKLVQLKVDVIVTTSAGAA
ncbi:MAG TPA: hypothetical protein VF089_13960 [Candidatus Binatia bacterium]